MDCEMCGEPIPPDTPCYQIRTGYLDDEDEFFPEEDIAYHCEGCGVERGNFNS